MRSPEVHSQSLQRREGQDPASRAGWTKFGLQHYKRVGCEYSQTVRACGGSWSGVPQREGPRARSSERFCLCSSSPPTLGSLLPLEPGQHALASGACVDLPSALHTPPHPTSTQQPPSPPSSHVRITVVVSSVRPSLTVCGSHSPQLDPPALFYAFFSHSASHLLTHHVICFLLRVPLSVGTLSSTRTGSLFCSPADPN